jgi:peroxiredoxin/HEAT repeat protein
LLFASLALVLVAAIFWRPLHQQCTVFFLLRSDAPSPEVLSAAVEEAGDPASLLLRLWKTQRIPHRQFVLAHLSTGATASPDLLRALEPLVIEAAADPDIAARAAAFAALARMKHRQLRSLASAQLSDADPAARLIGLQNLRSIASSNDVPVAVRLLDDPEPRVVVAAALLLRQVTGQDFGIRSTHALPLFTCIDTNPPPPPDLAAIRQGVQRGHDWWSAHEAAYAGLPATAAAPARAVALPAPDFTLDDPAGKPVRLSGFRGKSVLLVFWSPGASASLDDAAALNALQQRNPDRLVILGICTPPPPGCAGEHEHGDTSGHGHPPHHDPSASTAGAAPVTGGVVQGAIERLHIRFPMLLDPKGAVARRFSACEFPAYVLLDSDGLVRRRVVGFRSEPALAAMVAQLPEPR